MKETKDLLMKDYSDVNEKLTIVNVDSDKYVDLLKEKDDIRNELIKLETVKSNAKIEKAKIEAEDKREKVRNRITIGTFAVTTLVSIYGIIRTFRFDEDGTITSTLGRGILSSIIPKPNKK